MNDKLKKALAVGGASLIATSSFIPSGSAQGIDQAKKTLKKYANEGVNYVKNNSVHTTVTGALALTTLLLLAKSTFGGKTVSGLPFENEYQAFLWQRDLSDNKDVFKFIEQLADEGCKFELIEQNKEIKVKFTETKEGVLKLVLVDDEKAVEFTSEALMLALIGNMDNENKYVNKEGELTNEGALVLNSLTPYIVQQINDEYVKRTTADAHKALEEANEGLEEANKGLEEAEKKLKAAQEEENKAKAEVENAVEENKEGANQKLEEAKKATIEVQEAVDKAKEAVDEAQKAVDEAQKALTEAEKKVDIKLEMPKSKFKAGDSVQPEKKDD